MTVDELATVLGVPPNQTVRRTSWTGDGSTTGALRHKLLLSARELPAGRWGWRHDARPATATRGNCAGNGARC